MLKKIKAFALKAYAFIVKYAPRVKKAIGSSTGGILGILAGVGVSDQSVIVVALTLIGSILGTYFSPANKTASFEEYDVIQ